MVSKSDLKKPLNSLTNLRKEEVLKYRKAEEEEKIEVLGQESERKAIPWVQKEVEAQEKQEKSYFNLMAELLNKHIAKKVAYIRLLTQIFIHFASQEWIPKKYAVEIEPDDTGVVIYLKPTAYYGAFKASGLASYDFRYCQFLAMKLGHTVAKLEGHFRKSNGIILPDQEDLKVYAK